MDDFRRPFSVVARGNRMGSVGPRALLRCSLPLRHAILICTMEVDHDWCRAGLVEVIKIVTFPDGSQYQMPQEIAAAVHMKREGKSNLYFG